MDKVNIIYVHYKDTYNIPQQNEKNYKKKTKERAVAIKQLTGTSV